MAGIHNYDTIRISRKEYSRMLETSIEDLEEALKKLLLLKRLSGNYHVSGKDLRAIRNCACYTLASVDLHIMDIKI